MNLNLIYIIYIWAIEFLFLSPLIVVYFIQEKKNRIRHIIVTFSAPDGSQRAMPVKIGFSWTIFFFKGWALIFRGQFIEFLILLFGGTLLSGFSIASLSLKITWMAWTLSFVFIILSTCLSYYYILFGNKLRLRSLYRRGFSFENPENGDTSDLYDYIGEKPRTVQTGEYVKPGVVQGQTHQYVVPDEGVNEPEEDYDYSTLTMQDIKLLLKGEGIPFNSSMNKEELLELVEKHIAKEQRKEAKAKNTKYKDSIYYKMTVQELVKELDKREIKYTPTMKKADLVKLLVDNE